MGFALGARRDPVKGWKEDFGGFVKELDEEGED